MLTDGPTGHSAANCQLELNGWVRGDGHDHIFSVEIASTKSVASLKKAIRKEKHLTLNVFEADALDLWKACALTAYVWPALIRFTGLRASRGPRHRSARTGRS